MKLNVFFIILVFKQSRKKNLKFKVNNLICYHKISGKLVIFSQCGEKHRNCTRSILQSKYLKNHVIHIVSIVSYWSQIRWIRVWFKYYRLHLRCINTFGASYYFHELFFFCRKYTFFTSFGSNQKKNWVHKNKVENIDWDLTRETKKKLRGNSLFEAWHSNWRA